jgi:hypothetical protein
MTLDDLHAKGLTVAPIVWHETDFACVAHEHGYVLERSSLTAGWLHIVHLAYHYDEYPTLDEAKATLQMRHNHWVASMIDAAKGPTD